MRATILALICGVRRDLAAGGAIRTNHADVDGGDIVQDQAPLLDTFGNIASWGCPPKQLPRATQIE